MKDYLASQLRELPYFRALLRAVEARFYQDLALPEPVLDLGCGDGHFASQAFRAPLDWGLDPWWGPVLEASSRKAHYGLVCAEGSRMPYPENYFASAVSNSVLEHIPDLDRVIADAARVLQPGGRFVFCVPNHRFLDSLSIGRGLKSLGLGRLAEIYRRYFNKISRHYHCDSRAVWDERLGKAGFVIEESWDYFSPAALAALEWGHFFGVPSWFCKLMFNRWIIVPEDWNLALTDRLIRRHYQENPLHSQGVYSFYITRLGA